jgi:hypothetical protein
MALLIFIASIPLVNASGLSVLPAWIRLSDLMRGYQFNITLTINNPNDQEGTFLLSVVGQSSDWISFYSAGDQSVQINQITIPAQSSGNVIANFKIPSYVPNGNYLSNIYVGSIPPGYTPQNSSSLSIKMPIEVSLGIVGEQNLTANVININSTNTITSRLLIIKIDFQNTGNVIEIPRIEVSIKNNVTEVDNIVYNNTSVFVGNTSTIDINCNTTDYPVGDYIANVKFFLGDNLIAEKNLPFQKIEAKNPTIEGKIKEVTATNEVTSGQTAMIEVQFQNIGETDLKAKIDGDVYLGNNVVDNLESNETLIKIGKTETITAYFRPSQEGNYSIKGSVAFEGKKEPLSDITISAIGSSSSNVSMFDTQNLLLILFVVFAIVLIIVGIVYRKVKKPTKRK